MSPMCMYSAKDGFATNWHLSHYASRAQGGVGLVIIEATGVTRNGRITPGCLGLYKDEHVDHLKPIIDVAHSQGSKIGIQIGHAGRKASCAVPWRGAAPLPKDDPDAYDICAPSAIAYDESSHVPKELNVSEIQQLVKEFGLAAKRAVKAGFDVVELHGAHGYLIHQFYSALSNKRNDEYGGSFENRTRFLREIIQEVRSQIPNSMPLLLRLSCEDWLPDGWVIQDSVNLAKMVKPLGVDFIDCSGGGHYRSKPSKWGNTAEYADAIKKSAEIPTSAGWCSMEPAEDLNNILVKGQADVVVLGKRLLYDPYFVHNARRQLGMSKEDADPQWPPQYSWPRHYL